MADQPHYQLSGLVALLVTGGCHHDCVSSDPLTVPLGQDIHSSRDGAHIPPCSHLLHYKCYKEMLGQGLYACPTCGLAMQDMSSAWRSIDREVQSTPMPREYADLHRVILCRDCNKKTTAVFHIVGMKCGEEGCGSYNTAMDAGPLLR